MNYLHILFISILFSLASCSGGISGKIDRATTVSDTPITYIVDHPEEFGKDTEVTVKGKVKSSQKLPLLGSKLILEDSDGKEIAVELDGDSNVPNQGADFVVTGFIEQGAKFDIAGYEYNGIVLKQKETK